VPLFDCSVAGIVRSREMGSKNPWRVLCRSWQKEHLVRWRLERVGRTMRPAQAYPTALRAWCWSNSISICSSLFNSGKQKNTGPRRGNWKGLKDRKKLSFSRSLSAAFPACGTHDTLEAGILRLLVRDQSAGRPGR
jgi:hypothetical protein